MYIILCLVNKEADRPIPGQDKIRWESQAQDTGKKSGRVRGVMSETQRENRKYKMKES